jgi:MFS transporter, PPP family, 3-phenylpropionic acid transporter
MNLINTKQRTLTLQYTFIQMIYIMGYCTYFTFATVFLLSRGFSNSQVGIILTLASLSGILFQPLLASFVDRTQKLTPNMILAFISGFMIAIAFLLLTVSTNILLTALLFILAQMCFGAQIPLVTVLAMDHINHGVPINFSLARGIGSFAYAILSLVLGYLVNRFGSNVIMIVNILLGLVSIVLVLNFQRPEKSPRNHSNKEIQATGLLEFARKNLLFIAIIGCVTLVYISHIFISSFMIQIIEHAGGNSTDMGVATAVAAFLELPAMALFPWLYKRISNAGTILKVSAVFFVLKAILTLVAPNVTWFIVAQCLQFFAYALLTPASVYYVNELIGEADRVKGQTLMSMSMGLSGLVGNITGGLILDSSGGVPLMLLVGIGVSMIGVVTLFILDKQKHQSMSKHEDRSVV